jgi:polynucleotide 5'-kinase involved in rRNA processing
VLLARTLDIAGCTRAQVASPEDYNGVLCSFCRDSGEEFGFGFIREIDWEAQSAEILSTAIPPAPIRLLRVGSLRIDDRGRELGEAKPGSI